MTIETAVGLKADLQLARPFVISLRDAALKRLPNVDWFVLRFHETSHEVFVALPESYAKQKTQTYPLVIVHDARPLAGSAIEMSRLMAQTKEIRETIVVGIEASIDQVGGLPELAHFLSQVVLPWCRKHYRAHPFEAVLFGEGLESVTQAMPLPVRVLHADAPVTSLVHGLRELCGTGKQYGAEVAPLWTAPVSMLLGALRPVIGLLLDAGRPSGRLMDVGRPSGRLMEVDRPSGRQVGLKVHLRDNPYLIHSEVMDREYEVFAALPASWVPGGARRYPALFVLDANIEFSTVAEAAARLAARLETEEIVVIGIGTPRSEGPLRFLFRRFEELSPPAEGYGFDDPLGRFFRSLHAIRGQDARACMGLAPQLFAFLARELLPRLAKKLPIDLDDLGILGHSAGGTFVGYALCQDNSPFRRYVAVSPGVAISGAWLMKEGRAIARRAEQVRLSLGGEEKKNAFNIVAGIPETEAFAARLQRSPQLDVRCECFEGETHSSIFPRAVTAALTSIYSRAARAQRIRS